VGHRRGPGTSAAGRRAAAPRDTSQRPRDGLHELRVPRPGARSSWPFGATGRRTASSRLLSPVVRHQGPVSLACPQPRPWCEPTSPASWWQVHHSVVMQPSSTSGICWRSSNDEQGARDHAERMSGLRRITPHGTRAGRKPSHPDAASARIRGWSLTREEPATSFAPTENPGCPPKGGARCARLLDDVAFGPERLRGPATPGGQRLAAGGLQYTRFHTTHFAPVNGAKRCHWSQPTLSEWVASPSSQRRRLATTGSARTLLRLLPRSASSTAIRPLHSRQCHECRLLSPARWVSSNACADGWGWVRYFYGFVSVEPPSTTRRSTEADSL